MSNTCSHKKADSYTSYNGITSGRVICSHLIWRLSSNCALRHYSGLNSGRSICLYLIERLSSGCAVRLYSGLTSGCAVCSHPTAG